MELMKMTPAIKSVEAFRMRMAGKPHDEWTHDEWREFDAVSRAALPDMKAISAGFMALAEDCQRLTVKLEDNMKRCKQ